MALLMYMVRDGCAYLRSFYAPQTDAQIPDPDSVPPTSDTCTGRFAWIYKGVVVTGTNDVNDDVNQSIAEMMWGCKESDEEDLSGLLLQACRDSEDAVEYVVHHGATGWGAVTKIASGLGPVADDVSEQDMYSALYASLKKHEKYVNEAMGFAYANGDSELASWLQDLGDVVWNQCMACACVDDCKWMRDMAIRHNADNWDDAFLCACIGGHLQLAKWLHGTGNCENVDAVECVQAARDSGNPSLLDWVEYKCGYLAAFLDLEYE